MTRRILAIGIACALIGACATLAVIETAFAQKEGTIPPPGPTKQLTDGAIAHYPQGAVGHYQGAVDGPGDRLYLFDTVTGKTWIVLHPNDKNPKWQALMEAVEP